jgi:hypothetical protein
VYVRSLVSAYIWGSHSISDTLESCTVDAETSGEPHPETQRRIPEDRNVCARALCVCVCVCVYRERERGEVCVYIYV